MRKTTRLQAHSSLAGEKCAGGEQELEKGWVSQHGWSFQKFRLKLILRAYHSESRTACQLP
jgi:hypothetical protein